MPELPEQEQTFVRVTPIAPSKCVAHIGHPIGQGGLLLGGKYVDVSYNTALEIQFNPEREMILVYKDNGKWNIEKVDKL